MVTNIALTKIAEEEGCYIPDNPAYPECGKKVNVSMLQLFVLQNCLEILVTLSCAVDHI